MSEATDWDAEAADFDLAADHGLADPECRAAWRSLLLGVLPPAPARIADLGCGTGTLSQLLAQEGYDVTGVDFSAEMIRRARAKAPGLRFLVADAYEPPLDPESFDVVLSRHVLWAMPDPSTAVGRWAGLLGPEGRLILVEGHWHTGAGLTARECVAALTANGRSGEVTSLTDPVLWGGPLRDERYLVCSPNVSR